MKKLLIMAQAVIVAIGGVILWLVRKTEATTLELVLWLEMKRYLVLRDATKKGLPVFRNVITAMLIIAVLKTTKLFAGVIHLLDRITTSLVADAILRLESKLQPFRSAEIVVEEGWQK